MELKHCEIEGCLNKYRARNRCWTHRPPALVINKCSIENCSLKHEAKGFCGKHYRQWRRAEKLDPPTDKEYLKRHGKTLLGRFTALKRAAKDTQLPFDITRENHAELLKFNCHYCNGKLNLSGHGLDRIIPSKGYTLDNVVPCCYNCNKIKSNILTYDEMRVAMQAVLLYRNKIKGGSCGS